MADDSESTRILREAQRIAKRLVVEGVPWIVYELPPLQFDRRHTPSLVFESEFAVRRIRDFPANWRSLSDDALFALSWAS